MPFPNNKDDRWFEDYAAGNAYELGPIVMEEAEMLAFARRYDPQPFHTDPAIGAASGQGRVTVCLGAGLALGGSKVTR
jgi:acyl dehydratase